MKLTLPQYCTTSLSHNAFSRRFMVDASELDKGKGLVFGWLYDDAIDVGITLVSSVSGQTSDWYLEQEVRHGDETVSWEMRPTSDTVSRLPQLARYTLTIFND